MASRFRLGNHVVVVAESLACPPGSIFVCPPEYPFVDGNPVAIEKARDLGFTKTMFAMLTGLDLDKESHRNEQREDQLG